MSEKLYLITAKSRGGVLVLFYHPERYWHNSPNIAYIKLELHAAKECIKWEPAHCLFVEAKEAFLKDLAIRTGGHIYTITPPEFEALINKHDCHTVSTKQKKEKPAKEDVRKYVLYRDGSAVFGQLYYSCCGGETGDKDKACLMTLAEAEAKQKELERGGKYLWQLKKQRAKTERRQPIQDAPIEQPQKRVGYVLYKEGFDGKKIYRCESDVYVIIGNNAADVFMTKEQADFICYTIHLICQRGEALITPWKVEQIEF